LIQRSVDAQTFNLELNALIQRIAQGDTSALGQFYDTTHRQVYGLILRILNEASIAEEVLLDVYTQVWRQADDYDQKRGTPITWLMIIARCRAIDRRRAGRREQEHCAPLELGINEPAAGNNPEEETLASERQRFVRAALAELSPEQREVIELAYYSGLSHNEISERLTQPLGTVKTRIRMGMIKLRELLKPVVEGWR
jgi:RNA polymerase sigma-70 factor, ECF subfamily